MNTQIAAQNTGSEVKFNGSKHEIVCIRRAGFNILHTEGMDAAAKVTQLTYVPGEVYDPRIGVRQEWLVPLRNYWG